MKLARDLVWQGSNIFVTGGAGVGKSTFISMLKSEGLRFLFLAPTGLIASNGVVKGSTLHSFFMIPFGYANTKYMKALPPPKMEILKNVDAIVIDEVSMVRSDVFNYVDEMLKSAIGNSLPFGGKQIILLGDLFQLPPIVSSQAERDVLRDVHNGKYFFQTVSFRNGEFKTIEFDKVFRQSDEVFVNVLNRVKTGQATSEDFNLLNSNVKTGQDGLVVTTINSVVDIYNENELMMESGEEFHSKAVVDGDFNFKNTKMLETLKLKKGCRVLVIMNGLGYSNGTLGRFVTVNAGGELIVRTDRGDNVIIPLHEVQTVELTYDKEKKEVIEKVVGTCKQYPVVLGYAVSVHKCQGMTFDKMIFDIGRGAFDTGQLYVALSRCKTIDGLTLTKPISKEDMMVDRDVVNFYANLNK